MSAPGTRESLLVADVCAGAPCGPPPAAGHGYGHPGTLIRYSCPGLQCPRVWRLQASLLKPLLGHCKHHEFGGRRPKVFLA